MTAVSQRIPNYIGGVSQQADEKMLLGQVKDALNCYPDITLGMLKRPGGKFLGKLASLTANTADSAAWFSMFRDNQEKYIATVTSPGVATVTVSGTAATGTASYTNVVYTTTSAGSNATFNVSRTGGAYTVTVTAAGSNYKVGDVFTVSGSVLGGVAGTNNLTITVATVTAAGVPKVWNILNGAAATITYPAGKQASIESYLTATDYRSIKTLTINDFTYIVNSEKVVTAKAAPTFNPNRQATIVVTAVDHDTTYKVTIGTQTFSYTTPSSNSGKLTLDQVMLGIFNAITTASGFATKTIIDNTIYLTFNAATSVSGEAGPTGKDLRVFQDSVNSFTSLPEQAKNGQIVKINNTSANQDDFYLKYVQTSSGIAATYTQSGTTTVTVTTPAAHGLTNNELVDLVFTSGTGVNGTYTVTVTSTTTFTYTAAASQTTSGNVLVSSTSTTGYWEETIAPNVSTGFNEDTMPVVLIRTSLSPLTFKATFLDGSETVNNLPLLWEPRLVGDEESNSQPSFVGNTIQDIFLYNNRLGFLTEDNVSMSQAGDYYNFYNKSATTQTPADPIDLSCASVKPATIRSVLPITQGLLLFSDSQQFLMEAENGAFTPANVTINAIANYECDRYIKPVDLGSTVLYVSRNQSWARAFEIFTRGQRNSPTVTETTKIVPEWMPQTITEAVGSAQNGLWVASSRTSRYMYLHRFYEQGEERPMASWIRWYLPSNVIHTAIQNDILYVLTSGTEGYQITQYKLVLAPTTGGLINSLGNTVDPYLDGWCEVTDNTITSPAPPTAPTYDQVTGTTKVYLPTYFNTTKVIRFVVGLLKVGSPGTQSGYTNVATLLSDGGGTYFNIPGDVTGNFIYVGYEYNMELTLPRYYYSLGQAGVDFTGVTTTARMAFYTGLGGDIYFSIKDRSRPEWVSAGGSQIADFYTAGTSPFRDTFIYKVPIYQRPDNYTMKVTSNTPFPVSLVSMQWEGQYAPGFYRRT